MLSQTAEYALCATVHLGEQNGSPRTVQQIAEAIDAPSGYLAKVLQAMSKAGIVGSKRGLHGGFVLGGPPDEISVYDILQAVDPIKRFHSCPPENEERRELCALHRQLDDAMALIEKTFRAATIAALIEEGAHRSRCSQRCHRTCGRTAREAAAESQ